MESNISVNTALSSYNLFNAVSIKQFIIDQLKNGENESFKDADFLGSNLNSFIDIISVLLQQVLFNYSVNASESSFSNASLFESMSKIVSLLNYKPTGKQTSMLPVNITIDLPIDIDYTSSTQFSLPKFITINKNSSFVIKNDLVIPIDAGEKQLSVDTILFQGQITESQIYNATGDEFEIINIIDNNINKNNKFITDNFFVIYVDELNNGKWTEYKETTSLFLESSTSQVYEKSFIDGFNYQFKFGNGVNGKQLQENAKIVVFYLVSNGEESQIGDNIIINKTPTIYSSNLYNTILLSQYQTINYNNLDLTTIRISNTGPSSAISYPESVESIRNNAPKVFSSQNRLFSIPDYNTFISKYFNSFVKDSYVFTNDEYCNSFLNYFYELGLDSPQDDSRINLAQVSFMTSCNFNNVYCAILPKVNTIIQGKVPNYLNNQLKQEIVNKMLPFKGLTHNIVLIDPIYKAITFGSTNLDDSDFNENQLINKLVLVRNRLTKYSYTYIKDSCIDVFMKYFSEIKLGSSIDTSLLSQSINNIPGVKSFYMENINGNQDKKLTFYTWNPLYSNEDNYITQQIILSDSFVYNYFYDLNNISNLIKIVDE